MKNALLTAGGVLLAVGLTACGGQTASDRESGAGNKADEYKDTSHVVLYRNADSIPNVAKFCTDELGWASTLSGTDAGENKAATLVRLPEYDKVCAGEGASAR